MFHSFIIFCIVFICFLDKGRFTMAAKHHITVAEMYESNAVDLEKVTNSKILFL